MYALSQARHQYESQVCRASNAIVRRAARRVESCTSYYGWMYIVRFIRRSSFHHGVMRGAPAQSAHRAQVTGA